MKLETIKKKYTIKELIDFGFKKHYFRKNSKQHDYRFSINKKQTLHTRVLWDGNYDNFKQLTVVLCKQK